jgi:hypothetical protein
MAYELPLFNIGIYTADVDMSNEALNQFHCVNVKAAVNVPGYGNGGAALASCAAGDPILGVLQNNPIQGEAGTVTANGIAKAILGGTVTINQILAVDAFGQLKVATGGQYGVARALENGVLGDIVAVEVKQFGKQ